MSVALSPRESDEPLMGLVASYIRELDVNNKSALLRTLFGYDAQPLLFLPSGLNYVARETANYLHLTSNQILSVLTSFHYFTAYADASVSQRVQSRMLGISGSVRTRLGLGFGRFAALNWLRYCPECFYEDIKTGRRVHWRRSHQLPGVAVCASHGNLLISSNAPAGGTSRTQWPCAEDFLGTGESVAMAQDPRVLHLLREIASRSASLLSGESVTGVASGALRYRERLAERGFAMGSSQVRLDDLSDSICGFYGLEYLRWCGLYRTGQGARDWLVPLLCKGQANAPTISHLLLQLFLDSPADDACFMPDWPVCPSRFAEHGPGHRVTNISRSLVKVSCLARCECGMIFRVGVRVDMAPGLLILRYGQSYADKVICLAEEGLSPLKISELTGMNRETVRRMMRGVSLPQHSSLDSDLQVLKNEWVALVGRQTGRNPCVTARRENRKLYRQIMLKDREWMRTFRESMPNDRRRLGPADWRARDDEYLPLLRAAVECLRNERPVRWLSGISILLVADVPRGVRNQLQFLPSCRSFLKEVCESRLAFDKRRLRVQLEDSRGRGCQEPSVDILLTETGLGKSKLAVELAVYLRTLVDQ